MAANGHLIDQFLQDNSNKRTDRYGDSIENRARLLFEVAEALVSVWGPNRVGVRVAPSGTFNGMADSDPRACSVTSRSASTALISPISTSSSPGSRAAS
jgi:N-ethylmaleimide reductase